MNRSRVLAGALALVLLAGCAHAPNRNVLGARRVGLDLAYSDENLKLPPRVIAQIIPALPDDLSAAFPGIDKFLPKAPPAINPFACPKAPADAVPEDPATVAFAIRPVPGTYLVHNVGKFTLNGPLPITIPYPGYSKLVIKDVVVRDVPDPVYTSIRHVSYTVEEQILPTYTVSSFYDYDNKVLNLVKRVANLNGTLTTFVPTPAVEVFAFSGPGGTWNGAGIDTDTTEGLVVSGSIAATEPVDVCGQMIDAQKASTNEIEVNLRDGTQSGSRAASPTITHWATQYGGLPIRHEVHGSQVVQSDAGPVSVNIDVVSTLMSIKPVAR
jgi:hypothetical protein